jgi:hypothetical protein
MNTGETVVSKRLLPAKLFRTCGTSKGVMARRLPVQHVTSYHETWQAPRGLPELCVQRFVRLRMLSRHCVDPPCQGPIVAGNML